MVLRSGRCHRGLRLADWDDCTEDSRRQVPENRLLQICSYRIRYLQTKLVLSDQDYQNCIAFFQLHERLITCEKPS